MFVTLFPTTGMFQGFKSPSEQGARSASAHPSPLAEASRPRLPDIPAERSLQAGDWREGKGRGCLRFSIVWVLERFSSHAAPQRGGETRVSAACAFSSLNACPSCCGGGIALGSAGLCSTTNRSPKGDKHGPRADLYTCVSMWENQAFFVYAVACDEGESRFYLFGERVEEVSGRLSQEVAFPHGLFF